MVWWILGAGVLTGLVVLVLVLWSLLRHLRPLRLAVQRSMALAEDAAAMQDKVTALQGRIEGLQEKLEAAAARQRA